ncbi:flavin reductase family protein [Fibrobacter sp. UWEL]|uniref:flavin reductase family protein n=1 Tax=Fibrobacter sp. UWEL TaxID=1896209 RepID=UPI0009227D6F|nr:flavin reductase family protein [Fibrobacter sp. UWEL]SHK96038.1 NADH-FMN oxidoreductase RutF, flavin reductase (DIM6/NTAB) family [Fibrobacter sp. UWEL]
MRKNLGAKPYLYPQPVLVIGTYNEDGTPNAMVAAWGCVSDVNQVAIYVANSHRTMDNIKARKCFTVSMATAANIKEIDYLGLNSGHKVTEKFAKSGLTAVKSENIDAPLIAELPLTLECKMVSYAEEPELLLGEVVNVTADESILDASGKIDMKKLNPICYDSAGHGYYEIGEKVGNAFSDGKSIQ